MPYVTVVGDLRRRVALQAPTDSIDSYGQAIRTWSTYATVWASVISTPGSEPQSALMQSSVTTYTITMRYRTDVLPTHRMIYGEVTLNIVGLSTVDGVNKHLRITAVQVESDAPATTTTTTSTTTTAAPTTTTTTTTGGA
jgi:SPP1 family predicted phage head-tail adaptor